ncbi:DUF3800 domain-containing protein [Staphylococcus epidermidis]|uniref:DUF3800 domain-containing protein n=1 Tax=Staphylococcus epidermidis TaxID=1282 RepID=UPI00066A5434|nr:DUF3800 domain-containing protein [Staphylococcus epidermidis]MDU5817114.1 DUF3800 domain-containing protein [Staphylococcus sp.]DAL40297.1 MAG TPA_asm: Protein of unknown function (DUF3800) [Bacteriophage sp.]MCG1252017.1 DUF3800 domain-containing protein [Staphylococcus epidermidis]MCG1254128.1 DUF3800 domain-containing protein [Staphylococcus epidermidis]MCG1406263.1 DUF3800 domain-containing protein [Staphylococcus epidermidis]
MINLYCDESCHLENDKINIMVLGALAVPEFAKTTVFEEVKKIRKNMGISSHREIKWTKVSSAKLPYYKKLVDLIYDNESLKFRGVLLPDKEILNHGYYGRTHDDFYYIMYYYLVRKYMNTEENLSVYIDIKDTRSIEKVNKLRDILNKYALKNNVKKIEKIQHIRSHENVILQLTDLLIGAIGYTNRGLMSSPAKLELAEYIKQKFKTTLCTTSPFSNEKFNLFVLDQLKENL